jgi:NitT/TauT family transport system substrate-binding protein
MALLGISVLSGEQDRQVFPTAGPESARSEKLCLSGIGDEYTHRQGIAMNAFSVVFEAGGSRALCTRSCGMDSSRASTVFEPHPWRSFGRGSKEQSMITRRALTAAAILAGAGLAPARAQTLEKVTFGTNWLAQAEHGGFYQAVADGTYRRYGLDVTIVPGGPQANNRMLLPVGRIDFYMGGNMLQAFAAVEQNIPTVVVAASFQKEPQVLIAHPGEGFETFADLKKSNDIYISKEGLASFYQWMRTEHGFREEQVKPYTFNPAPFLANKKAVMQGYLSSEPVSIEMQAGFKPKVFLLADYGFDTYSTTIETRRELVEKRPETVRKFVEASILGWYNYLYGDNAAANALIRKDNPDMTDDRIKAAVELMKANGIVDSGDSLTLGIGAMTDARMKSFFDKMAKAGLYKADLDYRKSYTLQFVNKGLGKELRK